MRKEVLNYYTLLLITASILFCLSCTDNKSEGENETQNLPADTLKPKENPYKNAKIEVIVFDNDTLKQEAKYTGYGYAILVFGERQVNQPHKPGMPGLNGFKTADDAKKVGEFVAYKIRNNIMPPTVSIQELDSLGVLK